MNLAILGMAIGLSFIFGIGPYLLIQSIILMVAGGAGVWLFYVQHQFEGVYWERAEDWSFVASALQGSSFYKLPRVLQWFSGNIGFHHIHHLSPGIPNYNLEKCHKADPLFQQVKPITLFASFKSFTYRLWDEKRKMLVGYRHLRNIRTPKDRSPHS
jgi:omega-6 fatty acid desaturase (delta-12 desaturase)